MAGYDCVINPRPIREPTEDGPRKSKGALLTTARLVVFVINAQLLLLQPG